MKNILAILAYLALALTIIPAILVFNNVIDISTHKQLMLLGAVLWFIVAPIWFRKSRLDRKEI